MKKWMAVVMVSAGMLVASSSAWSCSMAGPNTHIGAVTAVDAATKTLTLLDAETQQLITFIVTPNLLKDIVKNQRVTVTFEQAGDDLLAKTISL
ncbi:MAG: hypothetical protein FD130_683 [Halothiobacillaceae bacterium]|nr:MAG: hypothetical protein FD130_683 [Halothiobacillaceae bacterium]